MLKIFVGSTLPHKEAAIRAALCNLNITNAEIILIDAKSSVRRQPEGLVEIRSGAAHRALEAWRGGWFTMGVEWMDGGPHPLEAGWDVISLGLENGFVSLLDMPPTDERQQFAETGACAIMWKFDKVITTIAPGQMLDPKDVAEARRRGLDRCTVTDVTDERVGCGTRDSTPFHTGGRVTRVDCLEIAVRIALAQYLTLSAIAT